MSAETFVEEKGKKLKEIRKEALEKSCAVQQVLYFVDEFLAKPMCGKCYPCALGTSEAQIRLTRISRDQDEVNETDIELLHRIGTQMIQGSLCKRGKDTGRFIREVLDNAQDEFLQHIAGTCPKKECRNLIKYVIVPELCNMCGECKNACRYDAVLGEERKSYFSGYPPFEIRLKRCTRCGECLDLCPTGAIVVHIKNNIADNS